ncbi:MAG: hypothetical protein K0R98_1341 [Rickettsiaceae bacterium]|jgi:hypothetical protein|nr:hypothetical protein [Rickettsiaceae bacterium]
MVVSLIKKVLPKKIRNLSTLANIIIGRKLYNNIANFQNNYIGIKRWEISKKLAGKPVQTIQPDVKELQETGVTMFQAGFPKEIVDQIYKEYLAVIDDPEHCIFRDDYGRATDKENGKYYTILASSVESLPSAKKLFTEELHSFLRQYYQSEYSLHSIYVWRTKHISEAHLQSIYPNQPYSILWHVDGHPIDTLKMFMVLSDVEEADGPLHYLTEQRTEELRNNGYFSRFKYGVSREEIENPKYLRKLVGPSGTTGFCNTTKCLHRAGVPAEGRQRDILQFRFQASTTPFEFPKSSDGFPLE